VAPLNWRRDELAHFGEQLAWLNEAEASSVYNHALQFTSKSHYGLDPATVVGIDKLDVKEPGPEASAWLSRRIGGGPVLVVFGERQVCRMVGSFFVENWQDIFCPSRDDVVILAEMGEGVLFYCHEDEFEFGQRRTA
jgi:hypothetical protein